MPLDSLEELENKIQIVKDNLQKKQDILIKVGISIFLICITMVNIILGHIKTAESHQRAGENDKKI